MSAQQTIPALQLEAGDYVLMLDHYGTVYYAVHEVVKLTENSVQTRFMGRLYWHRKHYSDLMLIPNAAVIQRLKELDDQRDELQKEKNRLINSMTRVVFK